ncbi:hypothetical protein PPYR_13213 [Photinus pyralis]|uniref:Uncharacterized protein n=1 Tax=Photinus pyralis TaxID=7054 RepID=A0A5N4A8E5_PHOPY|nr:uncharacterized protein LOC116178203 [Photinus pyralis]KAB0793593.1 hypothetical protein PPYR_13213 [Photinus pyralis]
MKSIAVILCICAFSGVYASKEWKKTKEECVKESGVEKDLLKYTWKSKNVTRDDKLIAFFKCVMVKQGSLTEPCNINLTYVKNVCEKMNTTNCSYVDTCEQKKGADCEETVYLVSQCIVPNLMVNGIKNVFEDCKNKTKADKELIKKMRKEGVISDDPEFKKYLVCVAEGFNAFDDNGNISLQHLKKMCSMKKIEDCSFIEECEKKKGDSKEETAYLALSCAYPKLFSQTKKD